MLTVHMLALTGTLLTQSPQWLIGGDGALLLRDEAAGIRTAMASVGPRATWAFHPLLQMSAFYRFAFHTERSVLQSTTMLHRTSLMLEGHVDISKTEFTLGVGPLASLNDYQLSATSGGPKLQSTVWAGGVATSLGIQKRIAGLMWRTGLDLFMFFPRTDVSVSLGVAFPLGGRR